AVKDKAFATKMIPAGGSENLALTGLPAGDYTVYCQVPGHEAAGMVASLHVGAAAPASTATAAAPSSSAATSASADAKIDFNATPGPNWHPFDPTLQP